MIDNPLYNIGTFGADYEGTEIRIGRGAGHIANKEVLLQNEGRDLYNKLCDVLKRNMRFNRIFIFNNFNPQPIGIFHSPNNFTGFKFFSLHAIFLHSLYSKISIIPSSLFHNTISSGSVRFLIKFIDATNDII